MKLGDMFKQVSQMTFDMAKGTIIVHRNYDTPNQESFELVGIKSHEEKRPNNIVFNFTDYVDIKVGDVLQQKNARILWKVFELDETIVGDTLLYFVAKVKKLDALGPVPSSITISNVSGNVQIGGHHAQQNITVTNSDVNDAIAELHKILEEKTLTDDQVEIIADALDVIANAVEKEKTPTLLERIHKKISLLSETFRHSQDIAARALPLVKIITDHFHG